VRVVEVGWKEKLTRCQPAERGKERLLPGSRLTLMKLLSPQEMGMEGAAGRSLTVKVMGSPGWA